MSKSENSWLGVLLDFSPAKNASTTNTALSEILAASREGAMRQDSMPETSISDNESNDNPNISDNESNDNPNISGNKLRSVIGSSSGSKREADDSPPNSRWKRMRSTVNQRIQTVQLVDDQQNGPASSTLTFTDSDTPTATKSVPPIQFQHDQDFKITDSLPSATVLQLISVYKQEIEYWKEWCKRKRYSDEDMVTGDKFVAFMTELVAPEVHRNRYNPHLSVLPLRNLASDYYDGHMPALVEVIAYIDMAQVLYLHQCHVHLVKPNMEGTLRLQEVNALVDTFHRQMNKRADNSHSISDVLLAHIYVITTPQVKGNRKVLVKMLYRGRNPRFVRGQSSRLTVIPPSKKREVDDILINARPQSNTQIQQSQRLGPRYLNLTKSTACAKGRATFGAYKLIDPSTSLYDNDDGLQEIHRETLTPPPNLQRQLFPFLEEMFASADWVQWILNIMTDRPEDEGRPRHSRYEYPDDSTPLIRIAVVLVYMRRVILQDVALLMAFEDCPGGVEWDHCLFAEHPVLASKEFLDYAENLRKTVLGKRVTEEEEEEEDERDRGTLIDDIESTESGQQQQQRKEQSQQQQQQQQGDMTELLSSPPLDPSSSAYTKPLVNSDDLQESSWQLPQQALLRLSSEPMQTSQKTSPEPELSQELLEDLPSEPLEGPPQEVYQASACEIQSPREDLPKCPPKPPLSSPQVSGAPSSSHQADKTDADRLIARRQAIENIKIAMVYLDQHARSQTSAAIAFSATAVAAIESLQSRMTILQDSLQKLQIKRALGQPQTF
ncbi:hypothetical protein EC991_003673 [Linnemannia zychae]|nr:hypothetical protein EC991_003673 [Linnemannia zychae]